MRFTSQDVSLIRAAASLAAHAPERMRAGHMSERLEALARRMAVRMEPEPAEAVETPVPLPRAA